jgi:5-methylcytosine-specific restriction enzyme subunit McrC
VRSVSLIEHETARIAENPTDRQFSAAEIAALDEMQKSQGVEAFRWISRTQIKTGQYVGMVATANVRLEILPKIDGLAEAGTRQVLMRMIATAWEIPVWDGEVAGHDDQNSDLLEILIKLFARRVLLQIRSGLYRTYQGHEGDLSRLRGKLDVSRQFTRLAAQPQWLACRYDEFTSDNPLNRLLLCAVAFLARRSTRSDTQRLLSEIRSHFEDVTEVSTPAALARAFTPDRTNKRWEVSATLARLFLLSSYQTVHGGAQQGIALLFDMNVPFEAYVAALARRTCTPLGYKVHAQGPQRCLATSGADRGAFHTRPDLTFERDGVTTIADTKWKRLDPTRPYFGVTPADAYQMHGYAHVYGSRSAILLYPYHAGIASRPGEQAAWRFVSGNSAFRVVTVDLANPRSLADLLPALLDDGVSARGGAGRKGS